MAIRPRRLTDEGYELDFYDIEHALYGLAKFEKQMMLKSLNIK